MSTALPTPFRLSNFPARAGSNWPFWGCWAEDIEIAWKVEACWPTASEELFQKDGLLLAFYTMMETSQPAKPTGLARGAEIWRLQKAHMSQSWIAGKCWESQIGVHFGVFGPGKCIFSCRRKLVCKTKAELGPKSKHHLPEWRWNLIVCCTKFLSKSHLQLPWHVFKVVTGRTVI